MQPFQKETGMIVINSGSSDTTVNNFVVIASGKRLIIETIFGRCYFGAPNETHMFEIGTTIKGNPEVRHMLPQIMIATNACLIFGSVRLYADPKTAINLYISRNVAAGDSTCHISLSGHFVDVQTASMSVILSKIKKQTGEAIFPTTLHGKFIQ